MLGYWWSKQESVTLESVTVKYSSGSAPAVDTDADAEVPKENNKKEESSDVKSSADIVKDMKIGWNLGNTLD